MPRLFERQEFEQPTIYKQKQSTEDRELTTEKEPIKTESREYTAGQVSQAEQERLMQNRQTKKEYINYFMTQTDLKDDKYWVDRLPTANLPQLEDLFDQHQEWQMQQQQQQITDVGKELGLDYSIVEQLQSVYPEEELAPRMELAGQIMTLIKNKPSASLMKQFTELVFPQQAEVEEPDAYRQMQTTKMYHEMTGDPEAGGMGIPVTEMPYEMAEEYDPTVSAIAQDLMQGLQGLGEGEQLDPTELLNAVMSTYYGNDESKREEAKYIINYIMQNVAGQSMNWEMEE